MKWTMIIICLFIFSSLAYAESTSLRCGNSLVTIGDHKMEVVQKCGEPHMKDTIALNVSLLTPRQRSRFGLSATQATFVDEWTYDSDKTYKIRKTKRIIRLLFEQNILIQIDTLVNY